MTNKVRKWLSIPFIFLFTLASLPICAFSFYFESEEGTNFHAHVKPHETWHLSLGVPTRTMSADASTFSQPPELELYAASAIVMDYETGYVIYEKDADTLRVPASMTKVMTAYLIFEEIEAGRLTLDTKITISHRVSDLSKNPNYPAMVYLREGSQVSVDMLLKLIFLPSASAACVAMAEEIAGSQESFVARMNETAKTLGIDAEYHNCHGASPNHITARAQAELTRSFLQRFPQVLDYTSLKSVYFNGKTYYNSNRLIQDSYRYEGADGFKTGTTSAAGFCLTATAVSGERRLITVVMKSLSDHWRFTDTTTLLDEGFAWMEANAALISETVKVA